MNIKNKKNNKNKNKKFKFNELPLLLMKLRPFIHTFLKEESEMFEMYIYTMSDHLLALCIVNG